ncbi:DUF6630 family protein [Sanguibacter massiliensis]|uniref:DUF6630 family protein n=1 Tax=Sanguibacter massiliensis TaxID=1973217 RepID=UPI00101AE531|nr:hypothetical protein [Sanguibacter massiliensis]
MADPRMIDRTFWDALCANVVDGARLRATIDEVLAAEVWLDDPDEPAWTPSDVVVSAITETMCAGAWYADWKDDRESFVTFLEGAVRAARGDGAAASLDLSGIPDLIVGDEATTAAAVEPLARLGLELCFIDEDSDAFPFLVVPSDRVRDLERQVAALGGVRLRPLPESRSWDDVPTAVSARSGDVTRETRPGRWAMAGIGIIALAQLARVAMRSDDLFDEGSAEIWQIALPILVVLAFVFWGIAALATRGVRRRERDLAAAHAPAHVGTTFVGALLTEAAQVVAAQQGQGWDRGSLDNVPFALTARGLVLGARGGAAELTVPRAAVRTVEVASVPYAALPASAAVLCCVVDGRSVEVPLVPLRNGSLTVPAGRRAARRLATRVLEQWPEVRGLTAERGAR